MKYMFEHLFGSKTRLKLLQIFFYNTDKYFFVRELARLIDVQLNAVRREIANLEKLGIISEVPKEQLKEVEAGTSKSKYYRVRIDSLVFSELGALLSKVKVMEEQEMIDEVSKKAGDLKLFLLSGIFTSDENSTIDMLLVGKVKPITMNNLIKKFEGVLRQSLRYTVMSEDEYVERKELGDKFLYNIFEANHVIVLDKISSNL